MWAVVQAADCRLAYWIRGLRSASGRPTGQRLQVCLRRGAVCLDDRALNVRAQPRYPITFHVMLAPLAALPLRDAVAVWAVLSVLAVAALPALIHRLTKIEPRRQLPAWALTAPFFIDALVLGQSDPINLLLVAAGLVSVTKGRGAIGMGLIGLAGLIKFLPLLHWASVLSRRRSIDVLVGVALTLRIWAGDSRGRGGLE